MHRREDEGRRDDMNARQAPAGALERDVCCSALPGAKAPELVGEDAMPTTAKRPSLGTVCRNCDAPSTRLARIVRFSRAGEQIHLIVCPFCYFQLGPKIKRRQP